MNRGKSIRTPWKSTHRLLAGSATLAALLPIAAAAQSTSQTSLEEIVVTAQKREETLQRVPIAVTAITAQTIEENRIVRVENIARLVPNVTVAEGATVAGPLNPNFSVRGLNSQNNQLVQQDSPIAVYIDGVYMGRNAGAAFDLADIERIEVLRGPQGTLFGKNTIGGAVSMVTKAPAGKLQLKQDFSVGNLGEFRAKTRVDLPEYAGFSAAFTYLHRQNRGYVKNEGSGVQWDVSQLFRGKLGPMVTSARNLGARNLDAGFGNLRYVPEGIDGLTIDYKLDYLKMKSVPNGIQSIALLNSTAANATIRFLPPPNGTCAGNCATGPIIVDPNPSNRVTNETVFELPSKAWGHSLTINYDPLDWLKLKNIAAYRRFDTFMGNELGAGHRLLDPASGQPIVSRWAGFFQAQHQASEEFNFNVTTHYADLTGGMLYFEEATNYFGRVFQLVTVPNYQYPVSNPATTAFTNNNSTSEFGQLSVHVTDQIDLVGGIRHTLEKRRSNSPEAPALSGYFTFSNDDWLLGVNYRPVDNMLLYAKMNTGYLSGGIYQGVPFNPTYSRQRELGAKLDMLDRRLRINTAGFWSTVKGFQTFSFVPATCNGSAAGCLINIGVEDIYGAEAEITALPIPGLLLGANAGWLVIDAPPLLAGVTNASLSSRWNLRFSAQYTFPTQIFAGTPSIGIDASYRGRVPFGPGGPLAPAQFQAQTYAQSRWVLDARATLADVELAGGRAKVSLWAKNITDKQYFDYILPGTINAQIIGQISPPATYGLDLTFEY